MSNITPYGLTRRLSKGIRLYLNPTHRCNLNCSHCNWLLFDCGMPAAKEEKKVGMWVHFLSKFPVKFGEVFILGGEPTLYKNIDILIRCLLAKKINVTIYTNMMHPGPFYLIPNNKRFRIIATYHGYNKELFYKNLLSIRNNLVIVKELDKKSISTKHDHVLVGAHNKQDIDRPFNGLAIGPDFRIFPSYRAYIEAYRTKLEESHVSYS